MENKKPTELKFKFKKPTQKTLDECKNWEYRIEGEYMVAYDKITGKRVYK
mgnify:CR=1 FL=1